MDVDSRRLLAALADELERARTAVDPLATLVSGYVRCCPPAERPLVIRDAQGVDALSQHLEVLAAFARAVSAGQPPADAAGAAILGEVAARLQAACGGEAVRPAGDAAGELDLFD